MEIPRRAMQGALDRLKGEAGDLGGQRLLAWLGWQEPAPREREADRVALLRIGLLCRRVFGLVLPAAPGLCAIGTELDPATAGLPGPPVTAQPALGASGVGLDPGAAFAACMGEAAERLAQIALPGEAAEVTLRRWPDGAPWPWPADRIYRHPGADHRAPPAPRSIGCAAGPSPDHARLSALLELAERDAVALWWRGGVRPARLEPDSPAGKAAAATCAALFQSDRAGPDLLLDLTTELGVPVVAALRFAEAGNGFLCGTAARPGFAAAARAAVLEMAQNELAVALAAAKRAAGLACTARDEAHLRRHATICAADCPAAPARPEPSVEAVDPAAGFAAIATRLFAQGFTVLEHDHSRAWLGIAVRRVVVPGLACEPSREVPVRLAAAMAATGGGPGTKGNVSLFA